MSSILFLSLFSLAAYATDNGAEFRIPLIPEPDSRPDYENRTNRKPAFLTAEELRIQSENEELKRALQPGDYAIIQNSVDGWQNQIVRIKSIYDTLVVVEKEDGNEAHIKYKNLSLSISPEVACVKSHGIDICKNEENVHYPLPTVSLGYPKGKVVRAFKNGAVVIRDGGDFVFDAEQIGIAVKCSPEREDICEGDYVMAEGFRGAEKFTFKGPIEKVFSNGMVYVKSDVFSILPINVSSVSKRLATLDENNDPSILTEINTDAKMPFRVNPEIEPYRAPAGVPITKDAE
ncbi:MAG: hypothetical protein M9962_09520 [Oligoflexia bacterium]|nr:hypothetical protein [Oligoflexia bacterium]